MKKPLVVTCASGLMGAALLAAFAEEPSLVQPRSGRSLYFSAASDTQTQPDWALEPAADSPLPACPGECDGQQPSGDVVPAGGILPPECELPSVVTAEEECASEAGGDEVLLMQGTSSSLYNGDRLYNPISTQSPPQDALALPPAPVAPQSNDEFSWADDSHATTHSLHGNPFAPHDADSSSQVESVQWPASPTGSEEATQQARPSQLTITQGSSGGIRHQSASEREVVGQSAAPSVQLEWRSGGEINVGQETTCLLGVHNVGGADAELVEVTAVFPASVQLLGASPQPDLTESDDADNSRLTWTIDRLDAGSESVLEVALIPLARGEISTQAEVRFSSQASGLFAVSEPMLAVSIDGPGSVMVGEPASHVVTVTNPGTGIATHVELEAIVPEGLEHSRGGRLLMDLGSLNPGESRSVRLALAAVRGGEHTIHVQARADASLVQSAACHVSVIAPNLITSIDGPGLRYLGRQAIYTLSVTNDGSVPTDNVRVMHKLPEGFRFVSSDRGAQFDEANSMLNWFVGRLDRGQAAQLQVTLEATQAGEFTHFVRATSENGAVSDAQVNTTVEATASLALELRDIDDPVELGTEAAYEIQVRNEGTAAATNVAVWCELPAGVEFASATGPSEHRLENGAVQFRPLTQLAPGESATFRVLVQADVLGNHRLRAHVSSDSVTEPLADEELTKFYGE